MKRTLAMLLALLMIVGLLPMQILADETVTEEIVTVAEADAEAPVEEPAAEETAAAEEITEVADEPVVVSEAVKADEEEDHGPVLGYVHLFSPGDNFWKMQEWNLEEHNGIMGWPHLGTAPWENYLIFFLNTWDAENETWVHEPVHVEFGDYLSGSLLKDGDYSFMPGADYTDYYYCMDVSTDGWDKTTKVTYTHDGEELSIPVDICRSEDGWYTSENMRNETYIIGHYETKQLDPENNAVYFGFMSEYWTLQSAEFTANQVEIVGYDSANAITVQNLGNSKYKIALDPWLVSTGKNFEIRAQITVVDSEGHVEIWEPSLWVGRDEDRQSANMGINDDWVEFFEENGVTKAMTHEETGLFYEWGDVVHSLKEVALPAGVSYDLPTNTLTLKNASLTHLNADYTWYDENNGHSGTNLPNENLTIKLVGTNTIKEQNHLLEIGMGLNTTLTGTGTLNLEATCTDPNEWPSVVNIHNGGKLILDGPTVNITGNVACETNDGWPTALNVDRTCELVVNKGKLNLNATNYRSALMLNGDYTQNGGQVTVTLKNEKAGIHLDDENMLENYVAYGISSKGYTTINGGTLTVDAYFGLEIGYDSGDPNNPDWPAQPNTKFTLNDGTVVVKGGFRGVEVYAPAELKGGSMKVTNQGYLNPRNNKVMGQALCVWDDVLKDVKTRLEISGGEHTFAAATGDNYICYGAICDGTAIIFSGGGTTMTGTYAITGQSVDAAVKNTLVVGADLDVVDLTTKTCRKILSGEVYVEEAGMTFYTNTIEADNTFNAQQWMESTTDECSQVRIGTHVEETIPGKAATCTATGISDGKKCTYCGKILLEQETVAAKGHTEVIDKAVAATCTKTGLTEGKHCSVCKAVLVKQKTVAMLAHTYDDNVDGTCNACNVNRETVETRQVTHMFRMYNPNTGEHFYTGSEVERQNLVDVGWQYEGVGFTFPANTGAPVHRLFEPVSGEHLYTMDEAEKDKLMAEGWNYEGIAFNSAYNTEAVQHRLHNPNATVGAYHFTFSLEEKQNLIDAGWEYQGIGWYSCWK